MVGLLLLFAALACAQVDTVPQLVGAGVNPVAEVSVSDNVAGLVIDNPVVGGDQPPDDTHATTYLRYTSIVDSGKTRTISAAVTAGIIPAGTDLYVTAATPGAGGRGNKGTGQGEMNLEPSAAGLITGIRSCWTGTGATQGSNLTYRLAVDPDEVDADELFTATVSDVTVTWTLNEDS
jgi:hypothetical protein